jgi:RNA-directed DNA polymerase
MMEPQGAGAATHDKKRRRRERSAQQVVSRYQKRIVKAEQAGKPGRVKHLQGMLVHSHSAKVVAVERVTNNDGKNTPGVDGQT